MKKRKSQTWIKRLLPGLLAVVLIAAITDVEAMATRTPPSDQGCPKSTSGLHHWLDWDSTDITPPTCTTEGSRRWACSECLDLVYVPVPALGHDWGGWTANGAGSEKRTCSRCSATETRSVAVPVTQPPATKAPTTQAPAAPAAPPTITKHPVDVTVVEGGNAAFEAGYSNATIARWRFISPDGQREIVYDKAAQEFPGLVVKDGEYSNMKLENVPLSLNGWRAACLYSNAAGSAQTNAALITVTPKDAAAAATPAPTAEPTPEPTLEPTATPEPTEEPSPTPTPSPEPEKAAASAANTLILAVAAVIGLGMICGTVLILSARKHR